VDDLALSVDPPCCRAVISTSMVDVLSCQAVISARAWEDNTAHCAVDDSTSRVDVLICRAVISTSMVDVPSCRAHLEISRLFCFG
jgi:hypothetical protein